VLPLVRKHWPLVVALALLWADIAALALSTTSANDGHLCYTLDDSFIHMAMARSFAEHGVWGPTRHGFGSTSSSPAWTLLLSLAYVAFGVNAAAPLVLNVLCATGVVWAAYAVLRAGRLRPGVVLAFLVAIIFLVPLPVMAFSGLEHNFHALVSLGLAYAATRLLTTEAKAKPFWSRNLALACVLSPLVVMARFEGGFLVLMVGVLLFVRRQPWHAVLIGALGLLPIIVYGLISVSQGAYFLPNSIMLKGNMPNVSSVEGMMRFFRWLRLGNLVRISHVFGLMLAALIVLGRQYRIRKTVWTVPAVMAMIFFGTALQHLALAKIGYFFRYEAYLMVLGITVVGLSRWWRAPGEPEPAAGARAAGRWAIAAVLLVFVAVPMVARAVLARSRIVSATHDIYRQQYHMGLFLREYYPDCSVAANDIGAINYLADIRCLDLWGLASVEVAQAKLENRFTARCIDELARKHRVRIAIGYDSWFREHGGLPTRWIRVARWQSEDRVVCFDRTVSFYAVDPAETARLRQNLQTFAPRLPRTVHYLEETGDNPGPPPDGAKASESARDRGRTFPKG